MHRPLGLATVQHSVALLLVSHDGARWLPTVIDGIGGQRAAIDRVIAIDTGSHDESPELLERAFADPQRHTVRRESGRVTFPGAVALAMEELADSDVEWLWILHDDSTPDPSALEMLLTAAREFPEADVLGPKLREWPSLKRLLELGVTISGTGRRETSLERGEYDQGQHDEIRTVLAVNTAGMLVRRSVLEELGGLDPQLPIFGNDIDFGWRAAAAGHTTLIVPQAVVFHAEAAHRGARRTPLTGRHTHFQERRAALYTLLANSRPWALPFQLLRLGLGTLIRMIGFVLVRDLGGALDDLAAYLNVVASGRQILAARRARRAVRNDNGAGVKELLAPWWLPYRHGLDVLSDLASALTNQAADVAERRRIALAEADPASFAARRQAEETARDDDEVPYETGWLVRFLTNPVAVLLVLVAILGVIGARAAFTDIRGGGLAPVPTGAGAWWRLHLESWHPLGDGTAVPAPPYILPLALLATVLGGHAGAAVTVLMVASFPVALWGAWRLLRVTGRLISHRGAPRWLVLWGALTYAIAPAVSGAWGDGRLGTVVSGALLPWLVHAALGFAEPEADRRWRAAWRAGLLLAVIVAFTPTAWLVALVLAVVVVVLAMIVVPQSRHDRSSWGPPAVALLVPPVALLPWWLPALRHGAGAGLLLDAGRLPAPAPDGWHLLVGRLPDLGGPWWLGVLLPVLALLALIPVRTRIPVLACWMGAVVSLAVALVLSVVDLHLAGGTVSPGLAFPMLALQGAFVMAAVLGAQGALAEGLVSGWRRWVTGAIAVLAGAAAIGSLAWFVVDGNESLHHDVHNGVPAYMLDTTTHSPREGVLVVRGDIQDGLTYAVLRGDGTTIGEDEILALTPQDQTLSSLVQQLATRPTAAVVDALAAQGIEYVVLPAPANPAISATIDAGVHLSRASAGSPATRAWSLDASPNPQALTGHHSILRIVLLVVQGLALVAIVVLCLPTVERRRSRR